MESQTTTKKNSNPFVMNEIEENTTFYYSNFKLFHDDSELLFASYLSFKNNLQAFLGEDWDTCARKAVFNTIDGSTIFMQSRDIFSNALEVWLELRKEINFSMEGSEKSQSRKNALQTSSNDTTSDNQPGKLNSQENECDMDLERGVSQKGGHSPKSQAADEEGGSQEGDRSRNYEKDSTQISEVGGNEDLRAFETFHQHVRAKFTENYINETFFKAVIQAFFVSAIKVWKKTLADYSYNPFFGPESGSFLTESKKFFINKLQNVYKTKLKMLKPILVATERIRDYIYKDNTKQIHAQDMDDKDKKNMNNFSSSLKVEKPAHFTIPINLPELKGDDEQDLKLNFNKLRINSNDGGSVLGKRSAVQANSVVEIKKMNKKFEKLLNQNTIEFAAHYVNSMAKTTSIDWQISRTFVTSMVEVNYNKLLQMENKLSNKADEVKNDIRIRFIQPAQDFYNRLMEVWIIFKAKSLSKEVLFTEYLEKVKSSLGSLWSDRFLTPTHNFFMTLYYEWHHLKQVETDTEEKVMLFTKKVKESMLKIWEDNIVKKAEELTSKTMTGPGRN